MRTLRCLLALIVSTALFASCSNSDDHNDTVCEDACSRQVSCGTIPAGELGSCRSACGSDVDPLAQCSNESSIVSCEDSCQSQSTCSGYASCIAACPACTTK
jgi:hypothetical protein